VGTGAVAALTIISPVVARGQNDAVGPLSLAAGAGWVTPTATYGRNVSTGYHIGPLQLGYLPARLPVGLALESFVDGFSVRSAVIHRLPTATSGVSTVWAGLADVFVGNLHCRTICPYLVGGVGIYNRAVEVWRTPGTAVTFNNPDLGFNRVMLTTSPHATHATDTENKYGEQAGAGLLFGWYPRLFIEARYHRIHTAAHSTTLVPVTLGLRF
jgi:hypothetical protein